MEDTVGRQGAKMAIACSLLMVALGIGAIFFGLTSLGNPMIFYLLAMVVLAALMIGMYAYTIAMARRKRT
jgi:Flp pilus assembly protein TadB